MSDHRKISTYLPHDIAADIRAESRRLGLPVSQLMQMAWSLAGPQVASAGGEPVMRSGAPPGRSLCPVCGALYRGDECDVCGYGDERT